MDTPIGLQSDRGRSADASVTLSQVGRTALLKVGAFGYVHDNPTGLVMFRIGGVGTKAVNKICIRLMANDTYTVERGHMDRTTYDYVVMEQHEGIYCDQLPDLIVELAKLQYRAKANA